ncbi:tRNA threonylcarbamoyladenosine biosynthesis protein TsaB [Sphingomonas sp. 28-63-12]|uniref:tRNA (adenosine(37)-N6)-threonylcarbamoyltransferase complex dimerization subunit type 1 TsaB n=1 Tax=Sphingomonas sp. 28-63-12 TaxID=1970434 RepID=UPI000BD617C5|nr:MAG: tRNA (adenosine(37)-N6)-threonylcarbamoyltransferase complex dimerization subunit type 1 TsaB [Sphingomonas sp. 28-63-12]
MRTLVIDTATAACSVALIEDDRLIAIGNERVGRGHAERLVPMIAELPGGGRADRIVVDCGPGSFTGIRVGVAAARGLGLGWSVPVYGYSSLALLAAAHFAAHPGHAPIAVILEGGHGEVFIQGFAGAPLAPIAAMQSLAPAAAIILLGDRTGVGSGTRFLAALDPALPLIDALPNAADLIALPAEFATLPPRPIYGRAPDATPATAKKAVVA